MLSRKQIVDGTEHKMKRHQHINPGRSPVNQKDLRQTIYTVNQCQKQTT